jgi:hypothetical protein
LAIATDDNQQTLLTVLLEMLVKVFLGEQMMVIHARRKSGTLLNVKKGFLLQHGLQGVGWKYDFCSHFGVLPY